MMRTFFVLSFLCIFILAPIIDGHRILVIVPLYGKSHWNYMKVFIDNLLNRGNEITCITSMTMDDPKPQNYSEILIDPPYLRQNLIKQEDVFKWSSKSTFSILTLSVGFIKDSCEHAFKNEQMQKFIHSEGEHFDLIVMEDVWSEAFLIFAHKFKAPIVTISPYGLDENFDYEMGLLLPVSHVSSTVLPYTDQMDFIERWHNVIHTAFGWTLRRFVHGPGQTELVNKYFSHLAPLPSIDQLRKNKSIIFVNAHHSIAYPRPKMPGMVYIGGAHIKPSKPLPDDLQAYLDESKHGVIYFSLGSAVNTSKLPKEKLNMFIDTFRQLEQRVIWKFEDDSIENLPENVLIRKWLPQTDILAHPNVVLFISQAGMFSNYEAINNGIQMLAIPFVSDQFRNAQLIESKGYGKKLDFADITQDLLHRTLNEMLSHDQYSNRAKEISAIFKDNLMHPMDEFMWWIEHVIKFRGTKHLKSHAADMSLFTYLLLDVILVNLIVIMTVIFGIGFVIKKLCCKMKSIDNNKKKKEN